MGKLTTHVLNVAAGIGAAGMRIELRGARASSVADPEMVLIAVTQTNHEGRCALPLLEGVALQKGRYALTFHVADYFSALGQALPEPPFLDDVVITFGIADAHQDYHVPLLVSPWSYSTYRGT